MACPNLTLEEAEELAHFGIPVVSDVRMPSVWRLSVDGVLVVPVPEPGTHLFARVVGLYRRMSAGAAGPHALTTSSCGHAAPPTAVWRLRVFVGPWPLIKHNRARWHQQWDTAALRRSSPRIMRMRPSAPFQPPSTLASLPSAAAPLGPPASPATVEAPADVRRSCLPVVTAAPWPLAWRGRLWIEPRASIGAEAELALLVEYRVLRGG
ncbi:hypothetical protein ZWY2020_007795 [Hordeum vulgare]|nr:hypothetical protein ZWY2020_007795 [Hordeum vulgare]